MTTLLLSLLVKPSGVMTVLDGSTRKGSHSSSIDLVTLQLCYTNQQDQLVLVATTRLASRDEHLYVACTALSHSV